LTSCFLSVLTVCCILNAVLPGFHPRALMLVALHGRIISFYHMGRDSCDSSSTLYKPLYPCHQVIRQYYFYNLFSCSLLCIKKFQLFSCSVGLSEGSSYIQTQQSSRTRLLTAFASRCTLLPAGPLSYHYKNSSYIPV
jgi:hypothetical protein